MGQNTCPCCGSSLLRHARQGGIYWFCTSCRQDMPTSFAGKLSRLDSLAARSHSIQSVN